MAILAKESERWLLLLALSIGTPLVMCASRIFGLPFPADDGTSSSDPSVNEQRLSRQSALWAIAAIALTNMADLPSQMGHYPKELTFWLKSSPLTCFCNVFNSFWIIGSSIAAHGVSFGFQRAVIRLSADRFGTNGPVTVTSRPIRTLLFVLGAIPQAVKLYSCNGVPFSQFVTTCYMLDFLNDELILFSSRTGFFGKNDDANASSAAYQFFGPVDPGSSKVHDQLIHLSLFSNMIWSAMLLSTILIKKVSQASNLQYYLWHSTGLAMTLVIWSMYLRSVFIFAPSDKVAQWAKQIAWPVVATLCALILHTMGTTAWDALVSYGMAAVLAFPYVGGLIIWPAVVVMTLCIYCSFPYLDSEHSKHFPVIGHFIWTSFNIACYFLAFYDASQTFRPGWLDWFG